MEFLAHSDDEDGKTAQPAVSVETELQLYLDQKCATSDILAFWEANKALFPRLYALTRKVFCAEKKTFRKLIQLNYNQDSSSSVVGSSEL